MSEQPPTELTVTLSSEPTRLTVRLSGELDHDTCDDLVDAVTARIAGVTRLREVRLDFRDLEWIDSSGLSALLMIHRHTSAAGATLRLDHRPAVLDRMLRLTNVLDHLTAPAAAGGAGAGAGAVADDEVSGAGSIG
ncbi:STAS domain-containing protein [Streptomyces ziwulingensis]|uniref:STAS domain-containing protein n=1 Tax=Streptomyces ziwulingensis TaxID=1045501 RepID=A0ABP9BTH1_9ACTN